jgi:hypothetical protein
MLRWKTGDTPGERLALVGTYRLKGTTLAFDEWYVIKRRPDGAYEAYREVVAFDGKIREVTWRSMTCGKMRDARARAHQHHTEINEGAQR